MLSSIEQRAFILNRTVFKLSYDNGKILKGHRSPSDQECVSCSGSGLMIYPLFIYFWKLLLFLANDSIFRIIIVFLIWKN